MLNLKTMPVILFLGLASCNNSYKSANELFSLSTLPENEKKQEVSFPTNGESGKVLNYILSDNKVHFSQISNYLETSNGENIFTQVMYGLLLKSERVCKNYLEFIVDTRNSIKVANQALDILPGIFTAFTSAGSSSLFTAAQISSIRSGVETTFSDLQLGSTAIKNSIESIRSIRLKMRSSIIKALEDDDQYYGTFPALLDIETYHQTCSVYDKIYFNFTEVEKLAELIAYKEAGPENKLAVVQGN